MHERLQEVQHIIKTKIQTGLGHISENDVPELPPPSSFDEQLQVLIEERVDAFSYTFGFLTYEEVERCKQANIKMIGTATTVHEAEYLYKHGQVDAITIQGSEAGGHRGSFLTPDRDIEQNSTVGLLTLLSQCRQVIPYDVPLLAAGGIANGNMLAAALMVGASAATVGTKFLTVTDVPLLVHPAHQQLLLGPSEARKKNISTEDQVKQGILLPTVLTRAFTGKPARSIRNAMTDAFQDHEKDILPWGLQASQILPYCMYSSKINNVQYQYLWAGQNYMLCEGQSTAQVIDDMVNGAKQVLQQQATHWSDQCTTSIKRNGQPQ
jgi:nitronate monooxygenase